MLVQPGKRPHIGLQGARWAVQRTVGMDQEKCHPARKPIFGNEAAGPLHKEQGNDYNADKILFQEARIIGQFFWYDRTIIGAEED